MTDDETRVALATAFLDTLPEHIDVTITLEALAIAMVEVATEGDRQAAMQTIRKEIHTALHLIEDWKDQER
jgi:hypothetical protein